MPWRDPPVADFDRDETFRWPFWEVGVDEADLFGDLHTRFNTVPMFIQDPHAFHSDVSEVALSSSSKEDFYARMEKRRDVRLGELRSFVEQLGLLDGYGFLPFDDNQWFTFLRVRAFASMDCLVAFFASFIGPNDRGELPSGTISRVPWCP